MANSPRFIVNIDCNFADLTFAETTGLYDATLRSYGYGSPNSDASAFESTTLVIRNLLTDTTFDTITTITASATSVDYVFDLTDLTVDGVQLYTETLGDGVYDFVYTIIDGASSYSYTVRKLILGNLWNLYHEAELELIGSTCNCHSNFVNDLLFGFAQLKSLEGSSICGNLQIFNNQYDFVENYLTNLQCGC
jgi:hypothetical protein